ncbi:PrsW family glutamic-type intramembrane protease [Leptolyngbya sp. Cla-17]|uniref:PrsW family glutamic-type intramembrane protease n=1 Tax=Leptolyngbya sp. Cla-17 TaxID=2803751 RepID=UPI0018D8F5E8|nr:PrsW family glutamic-type intramembrane protease [Leptolyngbya sp. Cla-17]
MLSSRGNTERRLPHYLLSSSESMAIGRDLRCEITLDASLYRSVSRRHAEVVPILGFESPHGERFWQVCDLDSSNGTFVNGERLQGCQVLQVGDRIMLGQNGPELVFEYQPQAEGQPLNSFGVALGTFPPALDPTLPPQKTVKSEDVSLTQLFPILSTGRELTHKAYLVPAMVTITFVVLLFLAIGNPAVFNLLLAAYLAIGALYFIYQLCGKQKPWWLLVAVATMTALVLISPVLDLFTLVFHHLLPGDLSSTNAATNFWLLLVKMFFGAGLMEELLKAVPVFIALGVGLRLRSPFKSRIGVWEPLDGILLGAASAVGFSLMETLGVYVPATYKSSLLAGQEAAQLAGLQLLIPRVLGLVAGHMAYSGYFGYFIGLSVLRFRQRWLILSVGLFTAAGLHTLWNTAGMLSPVFLAFVGVLSYAFLGAAILKARALSPTRSQNFATRFMR